MRVVLDTNVLIDSAKDQFSAEYKLLTAIREGDLTMLITPAILREYYHLLPQRLPNEAYLQELDEVLDMAEEVTPAPVETQIDDPEDYKFLQAAHGGQADLLVTSDNHLLAAGEVDDVRIVTPIEAWIKVQEDNGSTSEWTSWAKSLFSVGLIALILSCPGLVRADDVGQALNDLNQNQAEIQAKQNEINDLNQKINDLRNQRNTTAAQAQVIADQVARLQGRLAEAQLELNKTSLNIRLVSQQQKLTQQQIEGLVSVRDATRAQLKEVVKSLYQHEQLPMIEIFFNQDSLSGFLADRAAYKTLQDRYILLVNDLRDQEAKLTIHQQDLKAQKDDLSQLNSMLGQQQQELSDQKDQQAQFLQAKRQEQVAFDDKIAAAQQARQEIQQHIFTLKNSGIKLSLTQATDIAKYAGKLTGVRPALLLGVLKIETNLGTNIGNGVYPDDMQPESRDAFVRICAKLGLDPAKAPISARPRSYQGWGGAMGPAQIMPATWEVIADRVGQLVGQTTPNPYDLTDAFVATALLLADKGATSPAGEYEAVNRYLAGPNWQRFTWYGDRVLAVAQEYEKEGI